MDALMRDNLAKVQNSLHILLAEILIKGDRECTSWRNLPDIIQIPDY